MALVEANLCKALGLETLPQTKEELDQALAKLETLELNALTNIAPPLPTPPQMNTGSVAVRLSRLQKFIEEFQYNHTGKRFIQLKKTEGMYRVARTAKEIIQNGMPIKCIEAVFLGAYLTLGMKSLTRMPIAFKSCVGGNTSNTFQHIVMAVANGTGSQRRWGAIGLSRAKTLMDKPLTFTSLSDLLLDYKTSYEKEHHELLNIYVGLPFGRDEFNQIPIQWRVLRIKVSSLSWKNTIEKLLLLYSTNAFKFLTAYLNMHRLPDELNELFAGHLEPAATKMVSPKRTSKTNYLGSGRTSPAKKRKKKKKNKLKKVAAGEGATTVGGTKSGSTINDAKETKEEMKKEEGEEEGGQDMQEEEEEEEEEEDEEAKKARAKKEMKAAKKERKEQERKERAAREAKREIDEDGGLGHYTFPRGLSQSMLVCSASEKPLLLMHILREGSFASSIVFTASVDSTHRLARLLQV
jgi:hypothetical protein